MDDCKHKPPCPPGTPTWSCCKRSEIERAVFHGTIERPHGASLLAKMGLPMRAESATEKYNREQLRVKKGLLF